MSELWYTATQPLFFPPIHMVERFARCRRVVVLQEAQWQRHGGHTRAALMGANGWVRLSLPVRKKGQRPMDQLEVVPGWSGPVLCTLEGLYREQPGWRELGTRIMALVTACDGEGVRVCDVGEAIIRWLGRTLGLPYAVYRSRELVPERPPEPTAWMASFASHLGATDYLQGAKAISAYFVPGVFATHGCRVWGQDCHVAYEPRDVSVLDPLLRHGVGFVRELVCAGAGQGRAAGTVTRMEAFE